MNIGVPFPRRRHEAIIGRYRLKPSAKFEAVLFDLLTALLDSWSLWNIIAGSPEDGGKWRAAYLRRTYETGAYRAYEALVAEAAAEAGLSPTLAGQFAARYGELEPWPEIREVLGALRHERAPPGVVTNCSEELAAKTIGCIGIDFDIVVTAERAGFYKPDPRPYEMALDELGVMPGRCLFVAGSAYDLFGTSKVGLPTYWHDRIGMTRPSNSPEPIAHHRSLYPFIELVSNCVEMRYFVWYLRFDYQLRCRVTRVAVALSCSAEQRTELTNLARSRSEEARLVERAKIILACLEGKRNDEVSREIGVRPTLAASRAIYSCSCRTRSPKRARAVRFSRS